MRVINFNPANLTGDQQVWWNKWQTRATTATAQIIAEYPDLTEADIAAALNYGQAAAA